MSESTKYNANVPYTAPRDWAQHDRFCDYPWQCCSCGADDANRQRVEQREVYEHRRDVLQRVADVLNEIPFENFDRRSLSQEAVVTVTLSWRNLQRLRELFSRS